MSRSVRGGRNKYYTAESWARRAGNKHGSHYTTAQQKPITHRIERQVAKKACDEGVKE